MGVDQPGLRPSIPTRRASTSFNVLLSWSLRLHPPAACSSTKQNHPTTRGDLRNRLSFLSGIWTASRIDHEGAVHNTPRVSCSGNIFHFRFFAVPLWFYLWRESAIVQAIEVLWIFGEESAPFGIVRRFVRKLGSNCGEITI